MLTAILLQAAPVLAQDDAWWPSQQINVVTDCITDPALNDEWTQPPDTTGESCDSYTIDLLERPMIQSPSTEDDYFPSIDIDTLWIGLDSTWLYVGIGMRGLEDVNTVDNKLMFEIDSDLDDRGDYLIVHEGGKYPDDFANGTFVHAKSNEKLAVWFDTDSSIGATNATTADGPVSEMNGYESEVWKTGDEPDDGCRVQILDPRPTSPFVRFDFACRRSILDDLGDFFSIRGWLDRGVADNQNFYLHDKYGAEQYGSPYESNPNWNQGNTYEVDNTPWSGEPPPGQLPVEMTRFDAVVSGADVELSWATASEENNAGFEIQHAAGEGSFEAIAFVEGAGTTQSARDYSFRVSGLEFGRHHFRLLQIDFDGKTWMSPVVEVDVAEIPGSFVLKPVYPNPFNPTATVSFGVEVEQAVEIMMVDVLGKRVKTLYRGIPAAGSLHRVRVDGSDLPSGVYQVVMHSGGLVAVRTATLLK